MSKLANLKASIKRAKEKNEETIGHVTTLALAGVAGAGIGWARAKYADPVTGDWNLSKNLHVAVEPLLAIGSATVGVMYGGKYAEQLVGVGAAALAVYAANETESRVRAADKAAAAAPKK